MKVPFEDRRAAGRELARALSTQVGRDDLIVLALPRGGLPVAAEVARFLAAPLDIVLVRKLGVPWHPELAMGAIASGGARYINEDVVHGLRIDEEGLRKVETREGAELARRESAYRGDRPPPVLAGRCVVLVDDGLATGATMIAAVRAVRGLEPARIVVAVPVAPKEAVRAMRGIADEVVCLATPEPFGAVGAWYRVFDQTSDHEVRRILEDAWRDPEMSLGGNGQGLA